MDVLLKQRRTLGTITRMLLQESRNQPLMVVFEDLHWVDAATQEFLDLFADSLADANVLLLVNYRPGYAHEWTSRSYYTQLRVDPLGRDSAHELLVALLGDGDDLAALKQLIIEKTEGTPFFMEEMVQVLLDEGTLVRTGTAKLTRPLAALKIPPTVQAILAARIDRLAAEVKELLQTLAVMGREFPRSLIRTVTGKSDDALDRLLSDLQLGEFIYEQPAIADTTYVFKHTLTQEVAYNSVLLERRKVVHERVGAALETLYANAIDEHLVELAHHYGRSGNVDLAVQYLTHAGKQKMDEVRVAIAARTAGSAAPGSGTIIGDTAADAASAARARMEGAALGAVESIWRYPVKSMAGHEMSTAVLTASGVLGDRIYAVVDQATNRAASVRTWAAALLSYRCEFTNEPEVGAPAPGLRVGLPGSRMLAASGRAIDEHLSAAFGRKLTLMATIPEGLMVELPVGSLGVTQRGSQDLPIAAGVPLGAFVDYGSLHLVATSTVEHLQQLYPEGRFDIRRFRPNIVVRTQAEPFVENVWTGRTLAIGDEVLVRVTIPCPRCVNMILAQADLPHDPGILRTIAQHNMQDLGQFGALPCAGAYADVVRPGTIRRDDAVYCVD